jgi:hypothetical protein
MTVTVAELRMGMLIGGAAARLLECVILAALNVRVRVGAIVGAWIVGAPVGDCVGETRRAFAAVVGEEVGAVVGEMVAGETVAAVGELVGAGVCGYISIDPIAISGTDISLVPSSWYCTTQQYRICHPPYLCVIARPSNIMNL